MTRKEENFLLDSIEQIRYEVHENNHMLKQLIKVVNTWLSNHHNENEDDFGRNVLANLISSTVDLRKFRVK